MVNKAASLPLLEWEVGEETRKAGVYFAKSPLATEFIGGQHRAFSPITWCAIVPIDYKILFV